MDYNPLPEEPGLILVTICTFRTSTSGDITSGIVLLPDLAPKSI